MPFKYADREVSFPVLSFGSPFLGDTLSNFVSVPLSLFLSASHWIYSLISSEQAKRSQI